MNVRSSLSHGRASTRYPACVTSRYPPHWSSSKVTLQVDYKKLAGLAGLKNAASATTAFLNAKKKMLAAAPKPSTTEGNDAEESLPAPAKKVRKTLPSARNQVEAAEASVETTSPPAKKRKRANAVAEPSPKSAAILAAMEEEGEQEAVEAKPMKKARKGKKARAEEKVTSDGEDEAEPVKKARQGKKAQSEAKVKSESEEAED